MEHLRSPAGRGATRPAILKEALDRLAEGMGTRSQALDAFRKIKHSPGGLSASELKLALKFLGLHLSAKQTSAIMMHLDNEQDGNISLEEFLSLVWAHKLKQLQRKLGAAAHARGGIDAETLFQRYDTGHSGELEFEEFRRIVRCDVGVVESDVSDEELREMYRFVDSDGGGMIGIDGLKRLLPEEDGYRAMQERHSSVAGQALIRILDSAEQRRENMMYLFHRFDADGSGGLNREGFRQAMLALEVVLSPLELDELLGEMDRDGNGFVTPQKFSDRLRIAKKDRRAMEESLIDTRPLLQSSHGRDDSPGGRGDTHHRSALSASPTTRRYLRRTDSSPKYSRHRADTEREHGPQPGHELGHQPEPEPEPERSHLSAVSRLCREVDHWKDLTARAAKVAAEQTLAVGLMESNLRQEREHWKGEAAKALATEGATRESSLKYASSEEQGNRVAVMVAVAQDGAELQYAAAKLRADPEVVLTAAAQRPDGSVLQHATRELREDEEFMAIAQQPWVALDDLRTAECRLRAEQVTRLEGKLREIENRSAAANSDRISNSKVTIKQVERAAAKKVAEQTRLREAAEIRANAAERKLRDIENRSTAANSDRSSSSNATVKRVERAAAERLAEQTRLKEAAEIRANAAERKLTALENAVQDDDATTGPTKKELLEVGKHLATEKQATKYARKQMEAASQAAAKARRELSAALEANALLEADLHGTQRKLGAQEKEFKRAKAAFKKMVATLEEDLAATSKLLEELHQSKHPNAELVQAVDTDVSQVQIQWAGTLHRAIEATDLSTVRALLNSSHGARAAVTAQVDGTLAPMPLHRAIRKGDLDVFRRLTAEFTKAELPSVFNMQDTYTGFTSLHVAVEYGMADIADAIIRGGCDTRIQNRRGKTAWEHAILLIGCNNVPCVDPVFHMHAVGTNAHRQLELELAHQNDHHQASQTYSDPVEIDARSLHAWSLETFANWTQCSTSYDPGDGVFERTCKVEGVFPAMQIGQTTHNTMLLRVARQSCKTKKLHDEVTKLGRLTRNPECPSNIVKVLGILYGCAHRDGPEGFMMATEYCAFSLLEVILPEGTLAQYYSADLVLQQAQGIAWGLSYCHARGVLHLDLKLEHIRLTKVGGTHEEPVFTAKIDGWINSANFDSSGAPTHDYARDASDAVFGATDVLQLGTMILDMLTRTRNHPSGSQISAVSISPMARLLVESCWHPKQMDRLTSHQIHRLLRSIPAHVWMAETLPMGSHVPDAQVQLGPHDSAHVAEAVPPEPNPAARLLRLLESEMVDCPYEMELLSRKLEGVRLRSERKLEEQLFAERQLNQLNRDMAVRAATAALTAQLQAKTKEVDAVRSYGNRSIDLLKAAILDIGGFSDLELAALAPASSRLLADNGSTDAASTRQHSAKIRHQPEGTTANRNADDSSCTEVNGETLGGTNRNETTDVSDRLHSYRGSQLHPDRREWAFDDQHSHSVRSVREKQPAAFFAADRKSVASRHSRSPSRRSIPAHHRQRQHSRALIDSLGSLTTPAEHPLEVGDKEDEMADTVTVICPDGCASGDAVTFVIDADNDQIELDVVIPAGVVAGDEFEVQFDSSGSCGV